MVVRECGLGWKSALVGVFPVMYVCENSHGNMLGRRCQPLQKGIAVKGGTTRLGFFAKCQPNIVTTEGSECRQAPMNRFGMEMTSAGFLVVSLASHFPHHSYSFHMARCGV